MKDIRALVTERGVRVEVYPGREVVVDFDLELTFDYVDNCTWGCHHGGALLYEPDSFGLAEQVNLSEPTTEFKGRDFVRREEKDCEEARNHCEGQNVTERKIVDHLDAFLPERVWDLPAPTTKVEL